MIIRTIQSTTLNQQCYFDILHILFSFVQIFNSRQQTISDTIGDFCDGSSFQNLQIFKEDPCALQIRLYYDDVEMCNLLGSKTKKHKLGTYM